MKRRQFIRAISLSTLLAALPSQRGDRALAKKLSLTSDDIYWLISKPWLRMLAAAEGFPELDAAAYQTAFRYTPFTGYDDHPRIDIPIPNDPRGRTSDAAGPWQILSTTWDRTRREYPDIWLTDEPAFSPANQDRCALALTHRTGASDRLLAGTTVKAGHLAVSYDAFKKAIYADSIEWASLPGHNIGADSGQHTRPIHWLWSEYQWHLWEFCGYRRAIVPPLERMSVTSHFGPRWGSFHNGIDLEAAVGTPVRSPENAVVTKVAEDDRAGKYIVLCPNGYPEMQQSFCHLQEQSAAKGESVVAGQVIGLSGATGRVTGPHLHFGLWIDGGTIDPYRYLMMSEWFGEAEE